MANLLGFGNDQPWWWLSRSDAQLAGHHIAFVLVVVLACMNPMHW
jgi:hypothetical protein